MDTSTRERVWGRAGRRCEYCRIHQNDEPFYRLHIDHIAPKQHGGIDDPENLALACHHDNEHKGTNSPGSIPRPERSSVFFIPAVNAGRVIFVLKGL